MANYDDKLQVRGKATGPATEKVVFALASWVIIFILFERMGFIIFGSVGNFFGIPGLGIGGSLLGMGMAVFSIARTINFFVISVPEVTGLVTVNLFNKGLMVSYGPGLHFKFPWEQVGRENYIDLQLTSDVIEQDYPAIDGVMLKLKGMFQYEPSLSGLPRYVISSDETIKRGLGNIISGLVLEVVADKTAEEARAETTRINRKVKNFFEGLDEEGTPLPEKDRQDFEELYGIDLRVVSVPDLDYEERYQKAFSSRAVAEKIKETADRLQEDTGMSPKEALNASLIINESIIKHVQEVEGEGIHFAAGSLMAAANAIGKGTNEERGD